MHSKILSVVSVADHILEDIYFESEYGPVADARKKGRIYDSASLLRRISLEVLDLSIVQMTRNQEAHN